MPPHSAAFVEIRTALLGLQDDQRRRIADLLGAMHDPKPPLSGDVAALLGMIARLDPSDRRRLAAWCSRYLSRWGQVPVASSRGVTPGASRTGHDAPATTGVGDEPRR